MPLEPAPLGVAGGDQPAAGLGQLAGALAQLLHLARQLGGQPGVAEGQSGLVGQVGQQLVLAAAQRVPGRHRHRDAAEPFPAVHDRHLQPGSRRGGPLGRAARAPSVGACRRRAARPVARLALTARAAASATAGSSVDGSGLSPRRRLKSASASYGAAAAPNASRSATRTTRRRSGWKASATTAVASSEGQKPPVAHPPRGRRRPRRARSRRRPARWPGRAPGPG